MGRKSEVNYLTLIPPVKRQDYISTINGSRYGVYLYKQEDTKEAVEFLDRYNIAPLLKRFMSENITDSYYLKERLQDTFEELKKLQDKDVYLSDEEFIDYVRLWYGEYFCFTEEITYRIDEIYIP